MNLVILVSEMTKKLVWNPLFVRPLQDWEEEAVDEFFRALYAVNTPVHGEDSMAWSKLGGKFSVKSFYLKLVRMERRQFPFRSVWKAGVPSKVAFFCLVSCLGFHPYY